MEPCRRAAALFAPGPISWAAPGPRVASNKEECAMTRANHVPRKCRLPRLTIVLLAAGVLAIPALAGAQPHPNTRGPGWFIGFGIGGGSAGISADGSSSDREGGVAGSFRGGYCFTNELGLGLETNGWSKEDSGVTTTFSTGGATLYYYPASQGLVLRGGLGFGSADVSASSGGVTVSASESGFGFTLGAAYEFRVARTFSIGPQVDYSWMTLDDFDANYFMGALSFDWHFIPK